MAFKTILTVTDPDLGDRDLKLVAGMCEEVGAHLAVFVVKFAAPPPIGEYAAVVSEAWLEERRADLEKLKEREAAVTAFLASSPVSADISSEYPELARADEAIGRRARYADITVLGPEMLSRKTLKSEAIEGVLFSSGKPLLLIPDGATPTLKPKQIMVAWDSRVEVSKAVGQSLDLLSAADDVHLVLVDPREGAGEQGGEPGADMATYLVRHGVKVTVDRLPSQGRAIASVLRQHAIDTSAELMIMGAYGHSRLRERIFGGVTRSVIEQPFLPVLLAR